MAFTHVTLFGLRGRWARVLDRQHKILLVLLVEPQVGLFGKGKICFKVLDAILVSIVFLSPLLVLDGLKRGHVLWESLIY
jgi:hypothetical protein